HVDPLAARGIAAEALNQFFFVGWRAISSSLARNWPSGRPPPARSPLAKNSVGVPVMRSERPSSSTLSTGLAQEVPPGGTFGASLAASSSQALARSGEHHTAREWSALSGRITGYMNT